MGKRSLLHKKYEDNLKEIKKSLENIFDITFRTIETDQGEATVIFIDTMSDIQQISENIIKPLIKREIKGEDLDYIKEKILNIAISEYVMNLQELILQVLSGNTVILFSFDDRIIYCETKSYSNRGIEEPPTETVIKGPREGFTENINDNISLVRRRLRNQKLKLENINIGKGSNTNVIMVYLDGEAPSKLVNYIRKRLEDEEVEYLLDSNYIDERLQEKRSVFDTIGYTEKPDIAVTLITEGRVVILVDNTPFAVTAPHFFIEDMTTPDDYYSNKYAQNYFRIVRWVGLLIALLLPGLYLSIATHHFKLIPTVFVFRLAVTRAGVPYPMIVEIFIMMFFFQVLREAGIRLPQPIGSALSIVGALILGDAAIGAGLASEITVLVVALASISLFLIPKIYGAIVIWSNIIMIFGAVLGLPGFFIGFCIFVSHIAGLTSCGYPYLFPLGTFKNFNFKDLILRADLRDISDNIFEEGE
ncbi:spore germination protein [Alkaliphilus transvaalensis]|uniref:spore germination protein n=1 Tax=Alkaliphilus transvaalensis TaxID=114628 RepID=UPI00054F9493|nr:spore germination protein [Alkaliphilus transvaalensis]